MGIIAKYKVGSDEKKVANRVRLALKKGVTAKKLVNLKGASGRYKNAEIAEKPKKAKKKPAAKKPAKKATKAKKPKTPKKAAKPKKAKTPKAKKPAAKKAAKPK